MSDMRFGRFLIALLMLAGGGEVSEAAAQPSPTRSIAQLRDDLYSFRDGQQYSLFLVTPDGILLADPLDRAAGLWLREELAVRFPGRIVRFVLLTHHGIERAEGASAFDTAIIVGHRDYNSALSASRRVEPDRWRFVRDVKADYHERRAINLGGRTVELIHVPAARSPEATLLYFPAERIVFAVDPPPVTTVPFAFDAFTSNDVFNWMHAVASVNFETVVFGNGEMISRAEFAALGEYLDALRTAVVAGYEKGESLSELQGRGLVDAYSGNPHFQKRTEQTGALYRTMRLTRADVSVAGMATLSVRNPSGYCSSFSFCSAAGAVPAASAAVGLTFGRSSGIVGEMTFNAQTWSSRTRPSFSEEVALQQTRIAALFRYSPARSGKLTYAAVGGVSATLGYARGMNDLRGVLIPFGGRHEVNSADSNTGLTGGLNITRTVRDGFALTVPIRVTQMIGDLPNYWPSRFDVQIGVGVNVRVLRRVR